ncbi:MAG TPA: type II toxin-antitoxin system VapC family toxin [Pirellulaceae bacterium]
MIFLARGLKSSRPKNVRIKAERLAERCRKARTDGDVVGLSAITMSELEFGARYGGRYELEMTLIDGLTAPFERFDYDAIDCPDHFGQVREYLERRGIVIGAEDTFIAAHALALDATIVSNNAAHFSRVPGLKMANWLRE